MTAQIYQIRDFQSKKDLERLKQEAELNKMPNEIVNEAFPSVFGIDPRNYQAKESDPA